MNKILVVIQFIRRGGVENVAINYGMNLDKTKYNVSFMCVGVDTNQDESYKDEIERQGYKIYEIPENITTRFGKYQYLDRFFKENKFDIVHSHTIFFSALVLKAAKNNGVPVRVAHSHVMMWNHEENIKYKLYKTSMRFLLNRVANRKLACSKNAGKFLYGEREYLKHGQFVPNGINTEKFEFNNSYRNKIRSEFGIDSEAIIIGHVGTVYEIKNQAFLAEIFADFLKNHPNSYLMCVGERADDKPLLKKIDDLRINDSVILTGSRSDVYCFYSAFDIMIFPSLHEALPVSLIEAQASKLPCLISDTVTSEVKYNENVDFMSLKEAPEKWSNQAALLLKTDRNSISIENLKKDYEIQNVILTLNNIYN